MKVKNKSTFILNI